MGDGATHYAPPNLCNAFNLTGHPAVSVPCGIDERGMPVGLQIVGPLQHDARVLRIAFAYEQRTPWKDRHPDIRIGPSAGA
jgi:aspartyl-tRNA(Asn)/glutamyl-tRNA(Gln) amidotransferase subunit A